MPAVPVVSFSAAHDTHESAAPPSPGLHMVDKGGDGGGGGGGRGGVGRHQFTESRYCTYIRMYVHADTHTHTHTHTHTASWVPWVHTCTLLKHCHLGPSEE